MGEHVKTDRCFKIIGELERLLDGLALFFQLVLTPFAILFNLKLFSLVITYFVMVLQSGFTSAYNLEFFMQFVGLLFFMFGFNSSLWTHVLAPLKRLFVQCPANPYETAVEELETAEDLEEILEEYTESNNNLSLSDVENLRNEEVLEEDLKSNEVKNNTKRNNKLNLSEAQDLENEELNSNEAKKDTGKKINLNLSDAEDLENEEVLYKDISSNEEKKGTGKKNHLNL